jgi:hypothetical protein
MRARTITPETAHAHPTIFPYTLRGYISPYPTVVMVITDHQNASGIDANCCLSQRRTHTIIITLLKLAFIEYTSTRSPAECFNNRKRRNNLAIWIACTASAGDISVNFNFGCQYFIICVTYSEVKETISTIFKNCLKNRNLHVCGENTNLAINSMVKYITKQ